MAETISSQEESLIENQELFVATKPRSSKRAEADLAARNVEGPADAVHPDPRERTRDAQALRFLDANLTDVSPEQTAMAAAPPGWLEAVRSLPKVYGLTSLERKRIADKNQTFVQPPAPGPGDSLASGIVIGIVGTLGRMLMRGLNTLHAYRMEVLFEAIERRSPDQGLVTISNHRSVADDPFMLGAMLPPRILWRPQVMRWGLCSVDICFQNPLLAHFVTIGKALPIMRGGGVGHPFLFAAADKIIRGDWVHIYPEGRVVQSSIGYLKRGLGKMLTIAYEQRGGSVGLPVVLPMYHEGGENVMPQDQSTNDLLRRIPRVGNRMYAIIGDPVDLREIFEQYMPACARAGGTKSDPAECLRLYEQIADRLALSLRLLRAELRMRVHADHGLFLGDPYEVS